MKFNVSYDKGVSLYTLTTSENCDTDSWPMVPQVVFRQFQGTYDPEYGAIASAILFSRHCGTVADFAGAKVTIDSARSVRAIVPDIEEIYPIDSVKREIGQGVSSIVVGEASRMYDGRLRPGVVGKAARATTWSGDFVTNGARDSKQFIGGDIFTNALMVASSTNISAALALLLSGRNVRDIYVPKPPKEEEAEFDRIAEGLEHVSIKLNTV